MDNRCEKLLLYFVMRSDSFEGDCISWGQRDAAVSADDGDV